MINTSLPFAMEQLCFNGGGIIVSMFIVKLGTDARDVVNRQIPLLGINMGTLGYLAEIDRSSIDGALNHLMLDEYTIEKRMMLNGKVYHKEAVTLRKPAV